METPVGSGKEIESALELDWASAVPRRREEIVLKYMSGAEDRILSSNTTR